MPIKQFVNSKPKSSIIAVPEQGMKKHDFIDDFKDYYVHLLGRDENFFLFGLTEEQIVITRDHYDPVAIISQDEELQ